MHICNSRIWQSEVIIQMVRCGTCLGHVFRFVPMHVVRIMCCEKGCLTPSTTVANAAVKTNLMHFYLCDYTIKLPLVCVYERTSYSHSHANNSKHKNALVTAEVYSLLKRIEMKIVLNRMQFSPSHSLLLVCVRYSCKTINNQCVKAPRLGIVIRNVRIHLSTAKLFFFFCKKNDHRKYRQ